MKYFFVTCLFASTLLGQEGTQNECYQPVNPSEIIKEKGGAAPNTLDHKTVVFDYDGSVESFLHSFIKNRTSNSPGSMSFINGKTNIPDWVIPKKNIELKYTKIAPDLALIALPEQKLKQYCEHYILTFTSPEGGMATRLQFFDNSGLNRITVNIKFNIKTN